MAERGCPCCSEPMRAGQLGPLELDVCPRCGGIWFDCGELARVIAAGPQILRRLYDRAAPTVPRPGMRQSGAPICPACRAPLLEVEYASMPGVSLDACRFCEGFWVTRPIILHLAHALDTAPQSDPRRGGQSQQPAPPTVPAPPAFAAGASSSRPIPPPANAGQPPVYPPPSTVPVGPTPPPPPVPPHTAPAQRAADSMITCPKCGERNAERAPLCWACGEHLKGPVVGTCPRCEASMRRVVSESVTLSACDGCGSVWITPARLNALILQLLPAQDALLQQVARFRRENARALHLEVECPHCKSRMYGTPLGMITQQLVDTCGQCYGLFMSYGIFEDILRGQRR